MSLLRTSSPKYRGEGKTLAIEDRDSQDALDWLKSLFRTPTPNYHPKPPVVHQDEITDPAATDPPQQTEGAQPEQ